MPEVLPAVFKASTAKFRREHRFGVSVVGPWLPWWKVKAADLRGECSILVETNKCKHGYLLSGVAYQYGLFRYFNSGGGGAAAAATSHIVQVASIVRSARDMSPAQRDVPIAQEWGPPPHHRYVHGGLEISPQSKLPRNSLCIYFSAKS